MADKGSSSQRASSRDIEVGGLLGIGLDAKDGHQRMTKGDDFYLVGGSEETHEVMQELAIRIQEKAKRKGKTIRELTTDEFEDFARESL